MSFSLDLFKQRKQKLQLHLNQLSFILQDLQYTNELEQVSVLKKQLDQDHFQVVVVGEFSRGKSMFINALLGCKILPSSAKPTTAIRNVITYSEKPYIHLHFKDKKNKPEVITEKAFAKLVAPMLPIKGDRKTEKIFGQEMERLNTINFAEIGYPLQMCKEGITILDTPGLNDLDPAREQITNNIIPNADVAIFLLSAIKALSKSEMSFLKDRLIANDIQKIFIVINFKDNLPNDDSAKKVLRKIVNDLKSVLQNEKLYLVSAKEEMNRKRAGNGEVIMKRGMPVQIWDEQETGFIPFERDLSNYLQYERGTIKLGKPIKRAQKLIDEVVKKKIRFEKEGLKKSHSEMTENISSIRQQLREIRLMGEDAKGTLRLELLRSRLRLEPWYENQLAMITAEGIKAFDQEPSSTNLNSLPQIVEAAIAPLERELHSEKNSQIEHVLRKALEKSGELLNKELVKLDRHYETLFADSSDGLLALDKNDSSQEGILTYEINAFLDELLEDLVLGWREKSIVGKMFSGAGIALTMTISSIVGIGQAAWDWLIGAPNKKDSLRNELDVDLRNSNKEKLNGFVREWTEMAEGYTNHYGELIERQVADKEEQMRKLVNNLHLEGNEIDEKLHELEMMERKLKTLHRELSIITEVLHTREEVRV